MARATMRRGTASARAERERADAKNTVASRCVCVSLRHFLSLNVAVAYFSITIFHITISDIDIRSINFCIFSNLFVAAIDICDLDLLCFDF